MDDALSLTPDTTTLVVVDFQQKLAAAMDDGQRERALGNIEALLEGARLLDVPVVVTEQYPKGLGPTVDRIRSRLDAFAQRPTVIEKVEFDACANAGFADAFGAVQRSHVVLCGMEAHICVWQSARSLVQRGLAVHVPTDATCSRKPENRRIAEGLWARAGAVPTNTETVLFDLVGRAGTEEFKAISKLVK